MARTITPMIRSSHTTSIAPSMPIVGGRHGRSKRRSTAVRWSASLARPWWARSSLSIRISRTTTPCSGNATRRPRAAPSRTSMTRSPPQSPPRSTARASGRDRRQRLMQHMPRSRPRGGTTAPRVGIGRTRGASTERGIAAWPKAVVATTRPSPPSDPDRRPARATLGSRRQRIAVSMKARDLESVTTILAHLPGKRLRPAGTTART
mmetsp:Transcript_1615/g.4383  ORF Transcript_1615/g.4383 Transcript_1615/m.4383 type:complete len:207 (+) Transcript_1615:672-1292(+)